jgi:hypothetical protein
MASNPAIASLLQSKRPAGRVAELGPFGMKAPVHVVIAIRKFAELLKSKTSDYGTLDVIIAYTHDRGRWQKAHGLFDQVRAKTIKASSRGDTKMEAQYRFEEACVKTLYNLGGFSAPFDSDSPYWILPRALCAAEHFGIDRDTVLASIEAEPDAAGNSRPAGQSSGL